MDDDIRHDDEMNATIAAVNAQAANDASNAAAMAATVAAINQYGRAPAVCALWRLGRVGGQVDQIRISARWFDDARPRISPWRR